MSMTYLGHRPRKVYRAITNSTVYSYIVTIETCTFKVFTYIFQRESKEKLYRTKFKH